MNRSVGAMIASVIGPRFLGTEFKTSPDLDPGQWLLKREDF